MYVFLYNTIKWYWYGRLVNWFCIIHALNPPEGAQQQYRCTVKVRNVAPPLSETQIHNPPSRDAVTDSAAVATRSHADCRSKEGHTILSTALVNASGFHVADR